MKNNYKKGILNAEYHTNCKMYDVTFVPIEYFSAKYLRGTKDAFKKIVKASQIYANADGSEYPLKIYNVNLGYMVKKFRLNNYPIISANFKNIDKVLSNHKSNLFNNKYNIFIGGDHSITYHILKNIYDEYNKFEVVQLDAHSDYINEFNTYPHGSVMRECAKLNNVDKINHIGLRGNLNCGPAIADSLKQGNIVIDRNNLHLMNYQPDIKNKNIYLTIDTDFFDCTEFDSTNCLEPDGVLFKDGCCLLENIIKNNKIIGVDIVEFNTKIGNIKKTASYLVNLIIFILKILEEYE